MIYPKQIQKPKSLAARGGWWGVGLLLLFGLALLGQSLTANASGKKLQPPTGPKVLKTVLPNGLTVLIKPSNANQVVAVDLFVKSGPVYETLAQRGISALTQKVLIRGSAARSAREVALETEAAGAQISSGVAGEYGYVSLSTTVTGLEKGLEIFLDLLQNPAFAAAEIEKERQMLAESLAAREDQPFDAAYLGFAQAFYSGQPLGVPTAALVKSVQQLTRQDLLDWYRKIYVPNNMVISVVGKVEPQALLLKIEKALGKAARGLAPRPPEAAAEFPSANRVEYRQKKTNALFLVLGYPAPELTSRDALVMDVINRILGGSSDGRLYLELREKRGLAYSVYTGYEKMNGKSVIYAMMATAPGNFAGARDGIVREFKRLATETVPPAILSQAKQAIRGSYLMGHETNGAQGRLLGRYELLGQGYQYDEKYPELIQKVTAGDIKRVARKYFSAYTMSVVAAERPE